MPTRAFPSQRRLGTSSSLTATSRPSDRRSNVYSNALPSGVVWLIERDIDPRIDIPAKSLLPSGSIVYLRTAPTEVAAHGTCPRLRRQSIVSSHSSRVMAGDQVPWSRAVACVYRTSERSAESLALHEVRPSRRRGRRRSFTAAATARRETSQTRADGGRQLQRCLFEPGDVLGLVKTTTPSGSPQRSSLPEKYSS